MMQVCITTDVMPGARSIGQHFKMSCDDGENMLEKKQRYKTERAPREPLKAQSEWASGERQKAREEKGYTLPCATIRVNEEMRQALKLPACEFRA